MGIQAFLEAVDSALQGAGDPATLKRLGHQARQMADMTGWAAGVIDAQGRLDAELARLQDRARTLYEERSAHPMAELHDALGDLRGAIARYDAEVTGTGSEEDLEFF